jgi:hypothetical protein
MQEHAVLWRAGALMESAAGKGKASCWEPGRTLERVALKLAAMVHGCFLSTWEAEAGDCEFGASLDYTEKPCLKENKREKKFPEETESGRASTPHCVPSCPLLHVSPLKLSRALCLCFPAR